MDRKPELLLADVDERTRTLCRQIAAQFNCGLLIATDRQAVLSMLEHGDFSVMLLDVAAMPSAVDLLAVIKAKSARVEVILYAKNATVPDAVQAIRAGAFDYLEKPLRVETLERSIAEALDRSRCFQPSIPTLEELERHAIQQALAQADGDKIEAARMLSIGKTTLYRKLRQYAHDSQRRRGPTRQSA